MRKRTHVKVNPILENDEDDEIADIMRDVDNQLEDVDEQLKEVFASCDVPINESDMRSHVNKNNKSSSSSYDRAYDRAAAANSRQKASNNNNNNNININNNNVSSSYSKKHDDIRNEEIKGFADDSESSDDDDENDEKIQQQHHLNRHADIFDDITDSDDDNNKTHEEDEVKFAHEIGDKQAVGDLQDNVTTLKSQINEFKTRFLKERTALRESELLKLRIDDLENEKEELLREVEMGVLSNVPVGGMMRGVVATKETDAALTAGKAMEAELRAQLVKGDDDSSATIVEVSGNIAQSTREKIMALLEKILPFRKDIRQVEARFGTAVGAYMHFYRWVYMQFTIIALVLSVFMIYHLGHMISNGQIGKAFNLGEAYLFHFMEYDSYNTDEAFTYIFSLVVGLLIFLFNGGINIINEDAKRKRIMAASDGQEYKVARDVLCAWDNSLSTDAEVRDWSGKIGNDIMLLNEEVKTDGAVKNRTGLQILTKFGKRVIANLAYLLIIVISGYVVFFLQIRQKSLEGVIKIPFMTVPTIAVTFLNSVVPAALEFLTAFEEWDSSEMEFRFLTFRFYVSSTINLLLLEWAVVMAADPSFLNDTSPVYVPFYGTTSFQEMRTEMFDSSDCAVRDASDLAFEQVFSDSISKAFFFWLTGFMKKYEAILTGKDWIREELKIAELTVNNIFSVGLIMVTLPFSPLSVVFAPLVWFVNFKLEKIIIMGYYGKPKREMRGGKSGTIFAGFYLTTVLICPVPLVLYFVHSSSLYNDGSCGPFKNGVFHNGMQVLKETLSSHNEFLDIIWEWMVVKSMGAYFLMFAFILMINFKSNTVRVNFHATQNKERVMETLVATLKKQLNTKQNTIKRLKALNRDVGDDDDNDDNDD